jgi:hypothetical protein
MASSTRRRVSFPGVIRGQGQEVACTVAATEVNIPEFTTTYCCQHSITNIAKALAEGEYQLTTNGKVIAVRHLNGSWLRAFPG